MKNAFPTPDAMGFARTSEARTEGRRWTAIPRCTTLMLLVAAFPVIPAGLGHPAAWAAPPLVPMLDTMHARDHQLDGALTIRFELTQPANPFDPAQGRQKSTGVLTRSGQGVAISLTNSFGHPPVFRPPGVRDYRAVDFDLDGNLVVWRTLQRNILSAPSRNQAVETLQKQLVAPNGTVINEAHPHVQVQVYPIGSPDTLTDLQALVTNGGRGFSGFIRAVDDTRTEANGQITLNARGSYGPGLQGQWKVVVDPADDHLVRYARFTAEGQPHPTMIVQTSGLIETPTIKLASKGTLTYYLDAKSRYEISTKIVTVSDEADLQVWNDVQSRVTATDHPIGSETVDYRRDPPVRSFVGE